MQYYAVRYVSAGLGLEVVDVAIKRFGIDTDDLVAAYIGGGSTPQIGKRFGMTQRGSLDGSRNPEYR